MIARRFGRTGVAVSPIALGTSSWGAQRVGESAAGRDARIRELAEAFARGTLQARVLDTSNEYGATAEGPLAERFVGETLRRGWAHGLVLQTKLDRDVATGRFDGRRARASLEESLDRLGIDHLPVLYLHDAERIGFDAAMDDDGPVAALLAMRDAGLAGAIGVADGPVPLLERFVSTGLFDAVLTHNRWTLLDRSADRLLDAATARDMGVVNAAPYGAGILTGAPRFAGSYGYRPLRPETAEALAIIRSLCDDAGVPLSAAALQFSTRDARVHTTVVGASSLAGWMRAETDASIAIPDELWRRIDASIGPLPALDD